MLNEFKAIFVLPELKDGQEWACEQGCDHVKPTLHRNVYSQKWSHNGIVLEELAEHYYTCSRGHLLMVWDESTSDYVELPEHCYQEQ